MKKIVKAAFSVLGSLHCLNMLIDYAAVKGCVQSKGKYYSWERGDIYYTESGSGKPILLIHDLNVFSSETDWIEIVSGLSKTNTVYTIDLIGCGRSDKPALTYTNYMYVQLITDFIKNVIKEPTTVVTSGLSSAFVILANSLEKNLFSQIIMINPPTISSLNEMPDNRSKVLMRLSSIPIIGRTCYYMMTNKNNTEYYLSEKCFFNPFQMRHSHVKYAYQAAHLEKGNGRYLYASLNGKYLNADLTKALKEKDTKITIILGDKEPTVKDIKITYGKINQNIRFREVKNAKKLPQIETPGKIKAMIMEEMNIYEEREENEEKIG